MVAINAMMYQHCSASDFDEWVKLGAEGWGYKDLAPYVPAPISFVYQVMKPLTLDKSEGSSAPPKNTLPTFLTPMSKSKKEALLGYGIRGIPIVRRFVNRA